MDETTTRGQVSRRTIAKGMAWAAPAIPVVAMAPSAAASVAQCVEGSYAAGSCKENVQGDKFYYIQLCVQYVCTSGCTGVMTISKIETNSGAVLTTTPFNITVNASGTGCDTQVRQYTSGNLASTLTFTYSFTDCNGTKTGTFTEQAPPDCSTLPAGRQETGTSDVAPAPADAPAAPADAPAAPADAPAADAPSE